MASNRESASVTSWRGPGAPTERAIQNELAAEGLRAYAWSNGPHEAYSAHSHSYNKLIYVVQGTITFGLPDVHDRLQLQAGDRMYLPAGTRHDSTVGPYGVYCLEAHC